MPENNKPILALSEPLLFIPEKINFKSKKGRLDGISSPPLATLESLLQYVTPTPLEVPSSSDSSPEVLSPVCRLATAPVCMPRLAPPLLFDGLQRRSSHPLEQRTFSTSAPQPLSLSPPRRNSSNPLSVHPTLFTSNPSKTSPRPGQKAFQLPSYKTSLSSHVLEDAVQAVLDRDAQCFSEECSDDGDISNLYNESTSSETSHPTDSSFARTLLGDIRQGDTYIVAAEKIKVPVGTIKDIQEADNSGVLSNTTAGLRNTISINQQHYIPSSALWRGGGVIQTLKSFLCCCRRSKGNIDIFSEMSQTASIDVQYSPVPMTPVVVKLIVKVKEVFSFLLRPNMEVYQMKGLAIRVQAAIGTLYDMPAWHRFDVLARSIPVWCSPMMDVVEDLRSKHFSKEPTILAAAHHAIRLIELFFICDKDSCGRLSLANIKQMTRPLNISMTNSELKDLYNANADDDGMLGFRQFTNFYENLFDDSAIKPIFNAITSGQDVMTSSQLHRYSTRQGDYVTTAQIEAVVQDWGAGLNSQSLSLPEFSRYICSPANSWFDHKKGAVYQDMTKPLTNYFISSSHNTYLSGDQLTSESSPLMYKYALLRGCRCLEIDIWDGREEPIVTHGHTKTTKISFTEVIKTINQYAFVVSPYPVILSLEVHASLPQQDIMARVMKNIFGNKLHEPIAYSGIQLNDPSFTPEALRGRILVKAAMMNPSTGMNTTRKTSIQYLSPTFLGGGDDVSAFVNTESDNEGSDGPVVVVQKTVAPSLSGCVYLMANKLNHGNPSIHIPNAKPYECISLQERKADELMGVPFAELNKICCTRIYPRATRVDSSNFDPQLYWAGGSQFVALNLQTPDYSTRLNQVKFEDNGSSGYILKPPWLRAIGASYQDTGTTTIHIKVIKGGNLPKSARTIDPYVEAMISSVPGDDTSKNPIKTASVHSNGFNPTWNEVLILQSKVPEIAIVTLRVLNKKNESFVCETSVPLSCMRSGIRSCPLRDAHSRTIRGSYLLCDIKVFQEPLPLASPQASPMKDKRKTWVRKSSTGGTSIYSFAT